jgi:hypothetical protein
MKTLDLQTTLVLNPAWMPQHFISKRRCAELMTREHKADGLDNTFNKIKSVDWFDLDDNRHFDNPPWINTVKTQMVLPSIIIMNSKFIQSSTICKPDVSFEDLCRHFNHTCQICKNKFRRKDLSIEHIDPISKSHNDEDFNKTLTCKRCNNQKKDIENWTNPETGEALNGISCKDYVKMKFFVDQYRDEWAHFFIKQK